MMVHHCSLRSSKRVDKIVKVPDTITTWETEAFCLSANGFGLAPRVEFTVFQPFFLELTMPYSIIRGEHFELKATVFNYLSSCIMVTLHSEKKGLILLWMMWIIRKSSSLKVHYVVASKRSCSKVGQLHSATRGVPNLMQRVVLASLFLPPFSSLFLFLSMHVYGLQSFRLCLITVWPSTLTFFKPFSFLSPILWCYTDFFVLSNNLFYYSWSVPISCLKKKKKG